ncbi:Cof-type HAD-IIB family hydrolase [Vibrio sp. AK197]
MSDNQVKFIAADMDGTLLNEHGQLDPEFFDVFSKLEQKGIIFAAASGRQYYSLLDTFDAIKDRMMFVAENGTFVIHKGEELYSNPIDKPSVIAIIKEARKIPNTHIVLCGKRSAYIETQDQKANTEVQNYYHRCELVDDLLNVDDEFIKIALCHFEGTEEHVFPAINQQFGETHKVVVSAKIWLDVMDASASKGAAIKELQKRLGFSYEQTMSFGDYFNDVEMLEQSYHSYAVENAHPGVKQYARFRAPSNKESGVIQVLKQLIDAS